MLTALASINWLHVLIANVLCFMVGGVYFVLLFPRRYAAIMGRPYTPGEKMPAIFLVGPFLCNLVSTATTALLLRWLNINTLTGAAVFGVVVGVGYLAATTVNTGINPNIPHPLRYGLLSGTYFLLASLVMSLTLVALR